MERSDAVLVVQVHDERTRAAAYAIRREVFVEEQHVPVELELDDHDERAHHVLVLLDGLAVATGRLVTEPAGYADLDPGRGEVAHVGRIAVRRSARSLGLGLRVVRALEETAVARGLEVAYLSSQVAAVPFYERLGYVTYGTEFDDAGIAHRHMTRSL